MHLQDADENMTHELMYQHIQFRRTEKFIKNYLDSGQLINQKMDQNNDHKWL